MDDYSELFHHATSVIHDLMDDAAPVKATVVRNLRDAIVTLQARIAALEADLAETEETKQQAHKMIHQQHASIMKLKAENKALLSGQPVNGWQLVPVSPSIAMIEAWAALALARLMNPDANKGMTAATRENYAAMLTASASEQALQELATQAQELGMGYDERKA